MSGAGRELLLHRARDEGHHGRLCGIDPARGMLEQARKRSDIEWILGDLGAVSWEREFDLIVMTGHAFQVFVEDSELQTALAAIRSTLTEDGRFAFETRNPQVRAWERWDTEYTVQVTDNTGAVVLVECEIENPIEGDIVRLHHKFTSPSWCQPQVSHSTLRFLDVNSLSSFLVGAGLAIERQFGDWDRSPLADTAPEIITIARRIEV